MVRHGLLLGALLAGALLLGSAPASAVNPPKVRLVVNVGQGSIGGLTLGASQAQRVNSLGPPDYAVGATRAGEVTAIWSRTIDPTRAWAVATATTQGLLNLRLFDAFQTVRGDRRGTSLAAFLRHWPAASAPVSIVQHRRVVEYNVVVGKVVFAFNRKQTLQAVGLTPTDEQSFCVLPTPCLGSTLSFAT